MAITAPRALVPTRVDAQPRTGRPGRRRRSRAGLVIRIVLAAVTAGVYLGWHTPELTTAQVRLQGAAVWEIVSTS